jgi:hypothetical protein
MLVVEVVGRKGDIQEKYVALLHIAGPVKVAISEVEGAAHQLCIMSKSVGLRELAGGRHESMYARAFSSQLSNSPK